MRPSRIMPLLFVLLLCSISLFAQRNVFHFTDAPQLLRHSPYTCFYRIPVDSVHRVAYTDSAIDPQSNWMLQPAYTVPFQKGDSLLNTHIMPPGYYLLTDANENNINTRIIHIPSFNVNIFNLREMQLLTIDDDLQQPVSDAQVMFNGQNVVYDPGYKGYIIRNLDESSMISVRRGEDIMFYGYRAEKRTPYKNEYSSKPSRKEKRERNQTEYEGYFVTNKPKYHPGDTVKFKTYLQQPAGKKKLVTEPLQVKLYENYSGKEIIINPALKPEEPGVYFSEFVLGDTIHMDQYYTIYLTGTQSNIATTQQFKTEDYLLDETFLKVKGETLQYYQPNDTVQLYASAYTSNNLPVLDGTVSISVIPFDYINRPGDSVLFMPDTLYHTTMPVDPNGETYIGFPTTGFPNTNMRMNVFVSLVNSNFERKDTAFTLSYKTNPSYVHFTQKGNKLLAELIKNKQSISGPGTIIHYKAGKKVEQTISYPYEYTILPAESSVSFTGPDSVLYNHIVRASDFNSSDDFLKDTAYLQLSDPEKVWFYYSAYAGEDYVGSGIVKNDTLLRFYSPKGKTVTVTGGFQWRGQVENRRLEIFKFDRALQIDLHKKDFVFPGQTDSINIHLSDKEGKPIDKTNLTVLAFNNQFKEDFTPDLPYNYPLKPAIGDPDFAHSIEGTSVRYLSLAPTKDWLAKSHADTVFYYKNIFLLPDDIAWLNFDIPKSTLPQVAFFLKKGNEFYQPEVIYANGTPVYYRYSSGYNPAGIFLTPGIYNFSLRMPDGWYNINGIDICDQQKTNVFVNTDSIGFYYTKRRVADTLFTDKRASHLALFAGKQDMPDTLTNGEKDQLAATLLLFKNETPIEADFLQYPLQTIATNLRQLPWANDYSYQYNRYYNPEESPNYSLVGPLRMNDSIYFFQQNNTKLRFQPERNKIFSFRPDMTRVEKQYTFDLLSQHLSWQSTTPQYQFVTPNPQKFDTLDCTYVPSRASLHYELRDTPIVIHAISSNYPEVPETMKKAKLVYLAATMHHVHYLVVKSATDTFLYVNFPVGQTYNVPPGKYQGIVIWDNDSISYLPVTTVKAGGTTIVPIAYTHPQSKFDYNAPIPLLKKYTINEKLPRKEQILAKGGREILGSIYGIEPSKNPGIVSATKCGGVIAQTTIDATGSYSIYPIAPGTYDLNFIVNGNFVGTLKDVVVKADLSVRVDWRLYKRGAEVVEYYRPMRANSYGSSATISREEIRTMPTRNTADMASLSTGIYQQKQGGTYLNIGGGRADGTLYVIDGVQVRKNASTTGGPEGLIDKEINAKEGNYYLHSEKSKTFINDFANNMMQASGIRKNFRDWAIWEPNLWTNKNGDASFTATYPDNVTSWKTYVLAMNRKSYSARIITLTRAFKPLSAELSAPRFLRYGDSAEVIGKVANYTSNPYSLKVSFLQNGTSLLADTMTLHSSKVSRIMIAAPGNNSIDTTQLPLSFSITAPNGYTDGEERTIPVLPVGAIETEGMFLRINGDTVVTSIPDSAAGHYTGKAHVFVDGSLLEVLLNEIEHLKVYPYGCTEQLTSKLLAIYYEEEVKNLIGDKKLNNTVEKKKILESILRAQNRDGSFGWWQNTPNDVRITNYVISTFQKINKDGWLDYVIRKGLTYLNDNLQSALITDKIASLATLSGGHFATDYKLLLNELDTLQLDNYNRFTLVKIKKEQGLPYRKELDSLMKEAQETHHGIYWGGKYNYYDWYRNDLATTLQAYQVIKDDSIYGKRKEEVLDYILFKRRGGYYENTAQSGLVLTTILPDLIRTMNSASKNKPTRVLISGSITDSVSSFPKTYDVHDRNPKFTFNKKGFSPVYISVVYDHFNLQPKVHDSIFNVQIYFLNQTDTLLQLKQGEKITMRAVVHCKRESEYVMIEVPVPAGCVVSKSKDYAYRPNEVYRENFKDQTVIFCNWLPKGTFTFDVVLEARYKGSYSVNPARAGMMYYPKEYGNTIVKRMKIIGK
ncbi:alpha-2-macroglobulin family protein [Taibaiella soli]|uniref:Alpha-2-macroglobulin domain-containing protein n=1 Tax=Taibaiella soli TaxID=1649169 RepID=A0A2W2AXS8_9BACT|nr:alpha-2-macroglobulin family protein [Taibaiella soli]PZF72814.1 hypothetical protein DN068_10380 [Taibaiella soli]